MASIARDKNGTRRILFVAPDGKRPTIRLGKVSQRTAEGIKYRVEQLLEALQFKRPDGSRFGPMGDGPGTAHGQETRPRRPDSEPRTEAGGNAGTVSASLAGSHAKVDVQAGEPDCLGAGYAERRWTSFWRAGLSDLRK